MKRLLAVLCIILALVLTCGFVNAYSKTWELLSRDSETRTINLNDGDQVFGRVVIVGGSINFSISDPDSIIFLNYTISGSIDFRFTASKIGIYTLYFDNSLSEETKSVTLNYNTQHYIFGFPQEYIILFVIVGLALVAVVIFVAMSPKP